MEENQQLLQNFDSLWFFTSVFSTTTPPSPPPPSVGNSTQTIAVEPPEEEIATPIFQKQRNTELEEQRIEEMKTEEKEEKMRKCKRRKFVGEIMDLNYAVKEICECNNWLVFEEKSTWKGNYEQRKKKMPAFEDSMAMKQHIKSWAYAVACTVR